MAVIKWGMKKIHVQEGSTPEDTFKEMQKTNPELKLTTLEEKDGEYTVKQISYGKKG
jgi:hypothetical protein